MNHTHTHTHTHYTEQVLQSVYANHIQNIDHLSRTVSLHRLHVCNPLNDSV